MFLRVCFLTAVSLSCIGFATTTLADEPLFPNSDFESGTLDGWVAEGDAFSVQPTHGDNSSARGREASEHQGKFWIGTYEKYNAAEGTPGATRGDGPTGSLTSPEFTIVKPFIKYLVGGGHLPGQTGVKLICEGEEVELSTGVDSESMIPRTSDVKKFVGKRAKLVVFDSATGGWGHINVDAFEAADQPIPDVTKEFAFTDNISAVAYPETGYDQPLRPQFHFFSRENWLNDPNGMVFDGNKYHLFFQHNPKGTKWGNMTWGHATSFDMVHWVQQDHALLPYRIDGRAGTIFSGTAVVDHNNSLGKQVGDTKTLVAFFTFATKPKFYQAMAFSTDNGNSWSYWNEGRAVVENQGFDNGERDPKVFWHQASGLWVMALWVSRDPGRVRFFTSTNLTLWTASSDLMRDWAFECMDVVFLPVDGDPNQMKCVVYDASFDYEIGTFDGTGFASESGPLNAGGGNFYAAQTFYGAPDGRIVQIGWMRGGPNVAELHGLPHNQQMSFPCDLTLRTTPEGVRLFVWPAKEIESLSKKVHHRAPQTFSEGVDWLADIGPLDLVDLTVDFDPGSAKQVVFEFPGVTITYDVAKQALTHTGVDDSGAAKEMTTFTNLAPRNGSVRLRFLVDRLSLESYAFDGEQFHASYYSPTYGSAAQSIRAIGGDATMNQMIVRELASAW